MTIASVMGRSPSSTFFPRAITATRSFVREASAPAASCILSGVVQAGIVEQMPPVCHLEGVRQRSGNGATVTGIAVPGHDLDSGVAIQPSLDCSKFAVRQDIDDPPPLQIADQRNAGRAAKPNRQSGSRGDDRLRRADRPGRSEGTYPC